MKTSPNILILFVIFMISTSDVILSQTDDTPNNQGKLPSNYLQIGFINETALYYHNSINEKLSLKSGVSAFWNYTENNDGDGYQRYLNSSSPMNEQKLKSKGIYNNYEIIVSSQLLYSVTDYEYAEVLFGYGPAASYYFNLLRV